MTADIFGEEMNTLLASLDGLMIAMDKMDDVTPEALRMGAALHRRFADLIDAAADQIDQDLA